MNNLNTTLTIGFWFGEKAPTHNMEILTKIFDGENLLTEYNIFTTQYEEFKKRNTNNAIAYKSCLENEECYIFFPEPVGPKLTTFLEVKLMAESLSIRLNKTNQEIKRLDDEIKNLEAEKDTTNFIQKTFNEIFTGIELENIFNIYENSFSLQKDLNKYFLTIKDSLSNRGFDALFLSYAVANSIEQQS